MGGQGSKVYVLCVEPKEYKRFRPGTRPGGSVTGVTKKSFMCQMFMCLFRPLRKAFPSKSALLIKESRSHKKPSLINEEH